jgi:hypothetical protein
MQQIVARQGAIAPGLSRRAFPGRSRDPRARLLSIVRAAAGR